jgi:hypothetical protein
MGLEKMVLKKGTLIGTFIADQKHRFFESETFHCSAARRAGTAAEVQGVREGGDLADQRAGCEECAGRRRWRWRVLLG